MVPEEHSEEQLCLICLAAAVEIGPAGINRLVRGTRAAGEPLAAVFEMTARQLRHRFGLGEQASSVVASIDAPVEGGQWVLDELDRTQCRPVFADTAAYPAKLARHLGPAAPAVLFVAGEVSVLQEPCVAMVGSRQPSQAVERSARGLAASLAGSGLTVVSGGAVGTDTVAHQAAMGAGATAVVPACGLGRFVWRGIAHEDLCAGRWCVVGQFPPQEGWKSHYALMRNRTIVAAGDAVAAFDPRETGGTWNSCMHALGMRKPLLVCSSQSSSQQRRALRRLVRLGAVALDPGRMPGAQEFQQLVSDYRPLPESAQVPLFDSLDGCA